MSSRKYCAILIVVLNLDWKSRNKGGILVYSCLVCRDGREKVASNCKDHENTYTHQQNLKRYNKPTQVSRSSSAVPSVPALLTSFPTNVNEANWDNNVRALLRAINAKRDGLLYPADFPARILPETSRSPSPETLTGISGQFAFPRLKTTCAAMFKLQRCFHPLNSSTSLHSASLCVPIYHSSIASVCGLNLVESWSSVIDIVNDPVCGPHVEWHR